MPDPHRKSELMLATLFLAIIAAVPVTQTCIEVLSRERVQAMDVFRYRPAARQLRGFEQALEQKSWFQQHLRPAMQNLLFRTLRETGSKAVRGRQDWLFYRPDLRCLLEPDRVEVDRPDSKWVQPARRTSMQAVEASILRFRDQLQERGVTLIVMPVPGKPSVYPEFLSGRSEASFDNVRSPTEELLAALEQKNVVTVNLFAAFRTARRQKAGAETNQLYLARDTHWTPHGAQLAAETAALKLRALDLAPAPTKQFHTAAIPVTRWGDILEMTQIPALRAHYASELVDCRQILDPALGAMIPSPSERPGTYCYPGQQATILVLGDSFCRIYQYPEPASLGQVRSPAGPDSAQKTTRHLLPGSAGFISQLAFTLQSPADAIVSDGGAATDVRRKLSTNPEILEGKKVVIWEFVERDIALGAEGWQEVELPPRLP